MDGKTEQDRLAKVFSGNDDLRTMPAWLHVLRTRWHLTCCPCRKCARPNQAFALSALFVLTAEYSAVSDFVCGTEVSFKHLAHVFRHSAVHDFVIAACLLYSICEIFFLQCNVHMFSHNSLLPFSGRAVPDWLRCVHCVPPALRHWLPLWSHLFAVTIYCVSCAC